MINIKENLLDYFESVQKFISDLTEYFKVNRELFVSDPYKLIGNDFPKRGEFIIDLVEYKYVFHGGGCDFFMDEKVIRYDFAPLNNTFIKTSTWKFFKYLEDKFPDMNVVHSEVIDEMNNFCQEKDSFLFKHELGYYEIQLE